MRYTVIESHSYQTQINKLDDFRRIDEALFSVIWKLATIPDAFAVTNGSVRYWTTKALGGLPELLLVYTVDEPNREVEWVEPVE